MKIKGIEVSGEIYDIEDETARTNASEASSNASEAKTATQTLASTVSTLSSTVSSHSTDIGQLGDEIGDLADLETTAKIDLVSAINELAQGGGETPTILYGVLNIGQVDIDPEEGTAFILTNTQVAQALNYAGITADTPRAMELCIIRFRDGQSRHIKFAWSGTNFTFPYGMGCDWCTIDNNSTQIRLVSKDNNITYGQANITVMPIQVIF